MNELTQKHKNIVSGIFNEAANEYGTIGPRFFEYYGRKIVEFAEIGERDVILDVACGRGASLFPAQKKLGLSGEIIGIDLASKMLDKTKIEIEKRGISNIELYEMDGEDLTFSANKFDAVLCGFGLFYFPDIKKALSEIYRVMKHGGVFVASTFGARDSRWNSIRELIGHYQEKLEPIALVKTHMLDSKEEIINYFEDAGFTAIKILTEEKEFFYKDEDEWWRSIWAHGYRGFLKRLDEKTLQEFREDSYAIISKIKNENGLPEKFNILITKALKKLSS
jgi:ubiquinone/menaquinone biosynthesis C-methylase UbiE